MIKKWRWALTLVTCAVLAAMLDFSGLHAQQSGDSLMPVLVSLTHWTPFFWQQNYYGMLWPAVALGVHDPLHNFLLINFLCLVHGIGAHFAVAYFLLRRHLAFYVGALSLTLLLTLTSTHYVFDNLGPALFFATPLVFGLCAMWLLEGTVGLFKGAMAMGLLGLACWYNVTAPLMIAPLVAARPAFWQSLRGPWSMRGLAMRQVLALGIAALGGLALMKSQPYRGPELQLLPWQQWGHAVFAMACDLCAGVGQLHGVPLLLAALGLGMVFVMAACGASRHYRRHLWHLAPTFGRVVVFTGGYALFVAVQAWAASNLYSARYWFAAVLFVQIVIIAACLVPLVDSLSLRLPAKRVGALDLGTCVFMLCVALACFGPIGMTPVREALKAGPGRHNEAIDRLKPDFVAGDYWAVWPAVFYANMRRFEQGNAQPVLRGLAHRAEQGLDGVPQAAFMRPRVLVLDPKPHGYPWQEHVVQPNIVTLPSDEVARLHGR